MTTSSTPLVSVVIAVRDGAAFVGRAIDSVRRQTYPAVELIVVDDGSTDGTAEVAQAAAPDRLVRLEINRGVSTARNIGTALAAGELITYLDADDVMVEDKVRLQVIRLASDPHCDCVLTHQRLVLDPAVELPRWLALAPEQIDQESKLPISALVRTRSLLVAGGFDPDFRTSEEMDVLMRLTRSGAVLDTLDDVGVIRHIHGRNATYDHDQMEHDLLRAMSRMTRPGTAPAVSVIIPVRDGAAYLAEALQSVRAQRDVDPAAIEVIVVDDGSTDGSAQVASATDPSARVVQQPPLGPGVARNHGVLLSRGRTLAFLDADDLWVPSRLSQQLAALETGVDAVFGSAEEFVSPDLSPEQRATFRARPSQHSRIATTMLIRREAFARAGMFVTDRLMPETVIWYATAHDAGVSMTELDEVVLRRRLHGMNHSLRTAMAEQAYPQALKQILDRRRRRSQ